MTHESTYHFTRRVILDSFIRIAGWDFFKVYPIVRGVRGANVVCCASYSVSICASSAPNVQTQTLQSGEEVEVASVPRGSVGCRLAHDEDTRYNRPRFPIKSMHMRLRKPSRLREPLT